MQFEFATAHRIRFGSGVLKEVGALAAGFGTRALIVTGQNGARTQPLIDTLTIPFTVFSVDKEPTVTLILRGVEQSRAEACDVVIGFGGGSALDAGKAIAALATNAGDPLDYLEVVGRGQPLKNPPLPMIAIPTTAGTGSEVTRNAVLAAEAHRVKVSLRHPWMLPRIALVDPELTYSLPPHLTASTGMDALTQVIEPFVCNAPNPMTDSLARDAMKRASCALQRAYENGNDAEARQDMALASLFGGLTLANARLGAVHGFAGPIGGMFPAPHGAVCAKLLPLVMEVNIRAMCQREPENDALNRYDEVAYRLTGKSLALTGVKWVQHLCDTMEIPSLSTYGITREDIPTIVGKSRSASSMKGNPIVLTDEELTEILERAL
ncbi:MAG: iron-containing alcohol dehydrogenase [Anaerolineae bacterium]|nr:iron-containing alcohol dehydrogenase [Anaerolineae bacterium]